MNPPYCKRCGYHHFGRHHSEPVRDIDEPEDKSPTWPFVVLAIVGIGFVAAFIAVIFR